MKKKPWLIVILLCVVIIAVYAVADYIISNIYTMNTIPFQGYITDDSGQPFFGDVKMRFKFYASSSEQNSTLGVVIANDAERTVKIFNGQYATKLSIPDTALAELNKKKNIWVEVDILNDNKFTTLSPRVQLTSTAYALAVRGIGYDGVNRTLKMGAYATQNITNGPADGLIVSGPVVLGATDPGNNKLYVYGNFRIDGDMNITGTLESANRVGVLVWN